MQHIIGLGEYAISNNPLDTIKTFALSTCVGIVLSDPYMRVMSMAHVVMPNSSIDKVESLKTPTRYADTAVDFLLSKMLYSYGCKTNNLKISLYGGIESKYGDYFNIGERNVECIKQILKFKNLGFNYLETGGSYSRTITGFVANGEIEVCKLLLKNKESA